MNDSSLGHALSSRGCAGTEVPSPMKPHLYFIAAALGIRFFASFTVAYAQVTADTGSIAREIRRPTYEMQNIPYIPVRDEAWDRWLASAPESENIEDRRPEEDRQPKKEEAWPAMVGSLLHDQRASNLQGRARHQMAAIRGEFDRRRLATSRPSGDR